ncbi:TniQ family protein [Aureimonas phyllosphaerae]|uniref:TniQ family protein n=1 Tax=Aureimonas phyllosphaerae TaxID=1166078 RepID=UPI003A5C7063
MIHPDLVPSCHQDETPASFCSRTALAVGRSARDLCLDLGLRFQGLVDGDPVELDSLARLTHLPQGRFNGLPIVGHGHRFELAGQLLTRETLSRKALRVCPDCLAADVESGGGRADVRPYGRTLWLIDPIRTCFRHVRELVVASDDGRPNSLHDFAGLVAPSLASLSAVPKNVRKPTRFEHYVADRIAGGAPDGWLAPLPLYAVCRMAEVVGATELFGRRYRTDELTETQKYMADSVGYDIVKGGEQSIRSFLERLQNRFVASKTTWGPRATFGRLYELLAYECEDAAYDPLRDLMIRHVLETMPVGPGDDLFGRPVPERRLHSIHSAALQSGAHPKRLRKLAKAAGIIGKETDALSDDRVLVAAERMDVFLGHVAGSMSLKAAGRYLGVERPVDMLLLKSDLFEPWIEGGADGLGDHAYRRADLDRFLATVLIRKGDPDAGDLRPVGEAAKRANCSILEIFRLLVAGRLETVDLDPSARRCAAILVRVEEILPLVRQPDHGGMSLRDAERRLQLSNRRMKELLDAGHLHFRHARNPVNRCEQTVIDEADVAAFENRYVQLFHFARGAGVPPRRMRTILSGNKIEPAFVIGPTIFYEKSRLTNLPGTSPG